MSTVNEIKEFFVKAGLTVGDIRALHDKMIEKIVVVIIVLVLLDPQFPRKPLTANDILAIYFGKN